jgi:hypothetical protein
MLSPEEKEFIEDYMLFACKYCYDVKKLICEKIYTKCLDKSYYLASKMINKGWIKKEGTNG